MKTRHFLLALIAVVCISNTNAQSLKPYILGIESETSMEELKTSLKINLESEGIEVVGAYAPAADTQRWVMVISSEDLIAAVKQVKGISGFAASLRIAITTEDNKNIVSYTNPVYWGNAYFRNDYPNVAKYYKNLESKLSSAMGKTGQFAGTYFGSEDGVELEDLRKYRYMFGMPRFDDLVELNNFSSYSEAITKIDANINAGKEHISLVYSIEIPNEKLKLYGFALKGEDGESAFLPKIDITNPKHTAFLPYEMLVVDGKAFMLHGRFRIALSFPDLTMGTFTKIMSAPGDIKKLISTVTE